MNMVNAQGRAQNPSLLFLESDQERDNFFEITRELQAADALQSEAIFWLNCNDQEEEGTWICESDREGTQSSYRSGVAGL